MANASDCNDLYFFGEGSIHGNPRQVSIMGYEGERPVFIQLMTLASQTSTQTRVSRISFRPRVGGHLFLTLYRSTETKQTLPPLNGLLVRTDPHAALRVLAHHSSRDPSWTVNRRPETSPYGPARQASQSHVLASAILAQPPTC